MAGVWKRSERLAPMNSQLGGRDELGHPQPIPAPQETRGGGGSHNYNRLTTSSNARRENIKSWLHERHIPFTNELLEVQLLEIQNWPRARNRTSLISLRFLF
jgi:hypothetical protein